MGVLAFRRHGQQRIAQMQALLQQRVQHWNAQWAAAPGTCEVYVAATASAPLRGQWWSCAHTTVHLWLPDGALAALGAALAAVPPGQGGTLAEAIGRRAVQDLLAEIGAPGASVAGEPPAEQRDARYGVVGFELDLSGIAARLYLPMPLCDGLVPVPPPAASTPLARRRDALLTSSTRLYATLDLGEAGIDAATSLRPGEVLSAQRISEAVVRVHDASGSTVFSGTLHSSGGQKALRCTHVAPQSGKA